MAKPEFSECTLCGYELEWDTYDLVCVNFGSKHGTRDTARLITAYRQPNKEFHAAMRDGWELLAVILEKHASKYETTEELTECYHHAKGRMEEADMLAEGSTQHDQQWIFDALKKYGVERHHE
jgi:hypothetical protein